MPEQLKHDKLLDSLYKKLWGAPWESEFFIEETQIRNADSWLFLENTQCGDRLGIKEQVNQQKQEIGFYFTGQACQLAMGSAALFCQICQKYRWNKKFFQQWFFMKWEQMRVEDKQKFLGNVPELAQWSHLCQYPQRFQCFSMIYKLVDQWLEEKQ